VVGDSAPIVGLCSWRKHLFIFKTNGVWVLTGYDDDTFDLEYLDTNGLCAYRAYASSNAGVIWASHRGIMFFNGSNVQTLTSYVDGALTRPQFADGEYPKMAWANGRYYLLSGTDLYWWDSEYDVWGQETMGAVGTAGIQGFQLGDKQSHVLCLRKWNNTTSDSNEITALHTEEAFSDFASAGTSDGNYFAPIEVEFAPFIPEPDEDVVVTRFSLDGSWTNNDVAADKMNLYWGTTSAASTELGDAPQGARQYQVPNSVRGNPVYLRLAANYAEDFVLRNVKVEFSKVTRGEQTL
jgi:hypothetical protein